MNSLNGESSKPDPFYKPVWSSWEELTANEAVNIFEQHAGTLNHEECQQRQWSMEGGRWRWRMPSVDDTFSSHVATIPEKPWPAPPHPGPGETTEELGIRSVKGGYPEHQPKTISQPIVEGPRRYDPNSIIDVMDPLRARVFLAICDERERQDKKHGKQSHDPFIWLAILMEETGEAAEAAMHRRFGGPAKDTFRVEMLHVAAVAVAILEDMDKKGIK